jgi:hypothetical protein
MVGGILQLIYIGEQNLYLTECPQITFFKMIYKRHTNFAMDTILENFTTQVNFGQRAQCTLSKQGDLLNRLGIHIKLPAFEHTKKVSNHNIICSCSNCRLEEEKIIYGWANAMGHVLLEFIELKIGGKLIDRQYGEWMEIWTDLTQTAEKRLGYYEMIGKKDLISYSYDSFTNEQNLFVPFTFWFCRNVGSSIPCVSLMYHDIDITIKFREFDQCWVTNKANAPVPQIKKFHAYLWAEYIYLGLDERHKFGTESHIYLIEQVQLSENNIYDTNSGTIKINLDFDHPVKSLYFVIQRNDVNGRANGIHDDGYPKGNDWFNFTNQLNPRSNSDGLNETFKEAMIQFNGIDRFQSYMPAMYFRLYQPYYFHTRVPSLNYIYNYNFALQPEEITPTGSCNFSRIKDAKMVIRLSKKLEKYGVQVRVYAFSYNFLCFMGGLSGVMFST